MSELAGSARSRRRAARAAATDEDESGSSADPQQAQEPASLELAQSARARSRRARAAAAPVHEEPEQESDDEDQSDAVRSTRNRRAARRAAAAAAEEDEDEEVAASGSGEGGRRGRRQKREAAAAGTAEGGGGGGGGSEERHGATPRLAASLKGAADLAGRGSGLLRQGSRSLASVAGGAAAKLPRRRRNEEAEASEEGGDSKEGSRDVSRSTTPRQSVRSVAALLKAKEWGAKLFRQAAEVDKDELPPFDRASLIEGGEEALEEVRRRALLEWHGPPYNRHTPRSPRLAAAPPHPHPPTRPPPADG